MNEKSKKREWWTLKEPFKVTKTSLRSYMRKYFTGHISQYHRDFRKDPFILNLSLNFVYPIFKEDFISSGFNENEFDSFFRSVFKAKIKLIKC